jgi:hypothetical protein
MHLCTLTHTTHDTHTLTTHTHKYTHTHTHAGADDRAGQRHWAMINIGVLCVAYFVANAIPFFSAFSDILGAVTGVPIMFFWPSYLYVRVCECVCVCVCVGCLYGLCMRVCGMLVWSVSVSVCMSECVCEETPLDQSNFTSSPSSYVQQYKKTGEEMSKFDKYYTRFALYFLFPVGLSLCRCMYHTRTTHTHTHTHTCLCSYLYMCVCLHMYIQ